MVVFYVKFRWQFFLQTSLRSNKLIIHSWRRHSFLHLITFRVVCWENLRGRSGNTLLLLFLGTRCFVTFSHTRPFLESRPRPPIFVSSSILFRCVPSSVSHPPFHLPVPVGSRNYLPTLVLCPWHLRNILSVLLLRLCHPNPCLSSLYASLNNHLLNIEVSSTLHVVPQPLYLPISAPCLPHSPHASPTIRRRSVVGPAPYSKAGKDG